jgi:hypothetical protein
VNGFASLPGSWGDAAFSQHLFWAIGIFGLMLIILQAAFSLFVGHDGDTHADSHAGATGGHGGFASYFSLKGISATLLGFGFGGAYLDRTGWALGVAALGGLCLGLLIGATYVALVNSLSSLHSDGTGRLLDAVSRTGTVYLPIPAESVGPGEIQVAFGGRLQNVRAFTEGPPLPVGTSVRVVGLHGDQAVIVEKAAQL